MPMFREETRLELVLGKRDWKYGQACFVTTTVNRRNTFCCVKWVPLLISSFLRKAKKIIWNLFTVVVKKHFGKLSVPLLVPDAFSRTRTVVDIRFEISCNCMRSHAISCNLMWSHAITCDRMRSLRHRSQKIEFDQKLVPASHWCIILAFVTRPNAELPH